jgi:hypothetical protein
MSPRGFRVAGRRALSPDRGTIEFWLQPLDWDNAFIGNQFGTGLPSLTLLRFAHLGSPPERFVRALTVMQGRGSRQAEAAWTPMHPGRWTHVVCVWDGAAQTVYLDGQQQTLNQAMWSGASSKADQTQYDEWRQTAAGKDDDAYGLSFQPCGTLVDEWRVYPWAFTADEARNAYVRYFPDGAGRMVEPPRLVVNTAYDFYQKSISLKVACLPVNDVEPATVAVRIVRQGERDPALAIPRIPLDAALRGGWGAGVELAYADYELQAESLSAEGKALKSVALPMSRKQPEWWQNRLGQGEVVPKPWTPVEVEGATLRVWGRSYALGGGGMVTGLVSAAGEIMAAPPRLSGVVDGQAVQLEGTAPKVGNQSAAKAEWTGELRAKDLRAVVRGSMEYDGLVTYRVTLQPDGVATARIDRLTLEFPLRREHARQLIVNGGGHSFRHSWVVRMLPETGTNAFWSGWMGPGNKGVAAGSFCPVVWVGDDHRGICFFGENDKGWTPDAPVPAQELLPDGDRVLYRMNVIGRPVALAGEREFTFVLHATPTKPLPADWRALNGRGAAGKQTVRDGVDAFLGHTLTAPSATFNAGITFGMEPVSWEDAQRNASSLKKVIGDNPVLFYIDASWPQLGPSMAEFKPTLWWTGRMTWSREVEDYMVWIVNEYLSRGIIDGLYIDDVSCGSTRALYSTAYTTEAGQTQPGFSTMGFRRFLQRVWVLFEQQGKRPIIVPHMTYCFEIPALSFAECTVNGEDRDIPAFAGHFYPDVWSPDELRIMGSSEKWGFVTFWKPGVRAEIDYRFSLRAREWIRQQSRAMHALVAPHDTWYLWTWPTCNGIRPSLARFGMDDPAIRFVPYWDLGGAVAVTGQRTLVSAWAKPDKALLMIANLSKTNQIVKVSVDPEKLFGSGAVGVAAWEDIDTSLMPIDTGAASAEEIEKLQKQALPEDVGTELHPRYSAADHTANDLMAEVTGETKRTGEMEVKAAGDVAEVLVGRYDYRLLQVRPAAMRK